MLYSLLVARASDFEELLTQIEVDAKLLEEATLTKQTRSCSHRISKSNVERYDIQSSHNEVDAMEISRFSCAGYALKGQLRRRLNLDAEHAGDIRMEQANVSAGIN